MPFLPMCLWQLGFLVVLVIAIAIAIAASVLLLIVEYTVAQFF